MSDINTIQSKEDLLKLIKVEKKEITYLLYKLGIDNCYSKFEIPKKNGKARVIYAPNKKLKYIQRGIAYNLCLYMRNSGNISKDNISHGFNKGLSFITNADVHKNRKYILNYDLRDFFDQFNYGRVLGFFEKNRDFQYPRELAVLMSQLVCYKGKLPQGAPTSPVISNLIFNIVDLRILKLARKYKLNYTRYADDLTFSTNDKKIVDRYDKFTIELTNLITKSGFFINDKKTSFYYYSSNQEVTGLTVNKKVRVNRTYYVKTRAMANNQYKNGRFYLQDGTEGTISQLEGRFAFINQVEKYNNIHDSVTKKHDYNSLNSREKAYREFLFYKKFYMGEYPLLITEGKTDIRYIKAAIKSLKKNGSIDTKGLKIDDISQIRFYKRTKQDAYFFGIEKDGADSLGKLFPYYMGKNNMPNIMERLVRISNKNPKHPVILLFDNELGSKDKPIKKIVKLLNSKNGKIENRLATEWFCHVKYNLYIMVVPNISKKGEFQKEWDIECLFDEKTCSKVINGKRFIKEDSYDIENFYGKDIFSKYILSDYENVDFSGFVELFKVIDNIKKDYEERIKSLMV